jgi:membrane protease YdiL (CAAX protease family)
LLLVGVLIAIAYAGRFSSGKPSRNVLYEYSTTVGALFQYGLLLAFVLAISSGNRGLLALRRPASWPRALGLMVSLLVGIFVATAVLDSFLHGAREQGLTPSHWEPSHAGAYAANFIVIAGVAPVVEELTFRGLGYSLLERFGTWFAILAVGILFALAHGLLEAFLELAVFGCALAWLRSQTLSVYPGMLLHATFNGISLVAAVVR